MQLAMEVEKTYMYLMYLVHAKYKLDMYWYSYVQYNYQQNTIAIIDDDDVQLGAKTNLSPPPPPVNIIENKLTLDWRQEH